MKTLKWLSIAIGLMLILSVIVTGSWALTESAIQATSGERFCSACHTMRPFAETYAQDPHGGMNPRGLRADCADCHLPHTSQLEYLAAKARTGLYDVWAELRALLIEPDWIANLERREHYVYDSGCLSCHSHLMQAEGQTPTAAFGHQTYAKSEGAMRCVTCHSHVGHKDLLGRLSPAAGNPSPAPAQNATQERPQ